MRKRFLATRVLFMSLVFAATGGVVSAQRQANQKPSFSKGEELFYEAEFKRGLLRGANIGEFRFSARSTPVDARGDDPLRLEADVIGKGFFAKLAGVHFHEHVESVVNLDQFTALRTNELVEQGKRTRIADAVFDHEKRKVTWTERDPNQGQSPRVAVIDFMEPIQDVLSMIYFLRIQPLELGKPIEIPVSDSGRMFRLSVAVVERKQIKCVLGRVNAIRVEPAIFGEGRLLRDNGRISIWISDDNRRLPIWAHISLNLGTVDIKLKRVSYQ